MPVTGLQPAAGMIFFCGYNGCISAYLFDAVFNFLRILKKLRKRIAYIRVLKTKKLNKICEN